MGKKKKQGRTIIGKVITHTGKLVFEHINGDTVMVSKERVSRVERVHNNVNDTDEVRVVMKDGGYHVAHERFEIELLNFNKEKEQNERNRSKKQR